MRQRFLAVFLAVALLALAWSAALAQAPTAAAAGCGLTVKYPSSVKAYQNAYVQVSWSSNSSGGLGTVSYYYSEQPNSFAMSAARPQAIAYNANLHGYVFTIKLSNHFSQVHLNINVDTGFCTEVVKRTVKVKK
jgi:hypothetical protein